ncbi:hypothetical protein SS50377_23372 [Spironucleus salmonicida]|nr:hypothetical protein SS50377_23372 [Spironucleus salmonicida]
MLLICFGIQVHQQQLNEFIKTIGNSTQYGKFDPTNIDKIGEQVQQMYDKQSNYLDNFNTFRYSCVIPNEQGQPINKFYFAKGTSDLVTCSVPFTHYPNHQFDDVEDMIVWDYQDTQYSWPHFSGNSQLINNQIKKYLFKSNFTIFLQDGIQLLNQFMFLIHPNSNVKIYNTYNTEIIFNDLSGNFDPQVVSNFKQQDEFPNFDKCINIINTLNQSQNILILARGFYWNKQVENPRNITIINTFIQNTNQNNWIQGNVSVNLSSIVISRQFLTEFSQKFNSKLLFLYSNKLNQHDQILLVLQAYINQFISYEKVITFPIRSNLVLNQQYVNFLVRPIYNQLQNYIGFVAISINFNKLFMKIIPNHNYLVTSDLLIMQNEYLLYSIAQLQENVLSQKNLNYIFNDSFYESEQIVMNNSLTNKLRFQYKIQQQMINSSQIYVQNISLQKLISSPISNFTKPNKFFTRLDKQGYKYPRVFKDNTFLFQNISLQNNIRLVFIIPESQFTDHHLNFDKNNIIKYSSILTQFNCSLLDLPQNCLTNLDPIQFQIPYQLILIYYDDKQVDIVFDSTMIIPCKANDVIQNISGDYSCQKDKFKFVIQKDIRYQMLQQAILFIKSKSNIQIQFLLYHKNMILVQNRQNNIVGFSQNKQLNFYKTRIISLVPIIYREQRRQSFYTYCKTSPQSLYMYNIQQPFKMIVNPLNSSYSISTYNYTNIMSAYNIRTINSTMLLAFQINNYYNEHKKIYAIKEQNFFIIDQYAQVLFSPLQMKVNLTYRFRNKNLFETDLCQHNQYSIPMLQFLFKMRFIEYSIYISSQQYCLIFKIIDDSLNKDFLQKINNTNMYNLTLPWDQLLPYISMSNVPCFTGLQYINEYIDEIFNYPEKYYKEFDEPHENIILSQQQYNYYWYYLLTFLIFVIVTVTVIICH